MQSSEKVNGTGNSRIGVLLIHGLCGSPAELRFIANGLTRAGYTVRCPSLAGHGTTEEELIASTWHDWYASAEQALDELADVCDTVIVGGLSTGAVLSLMLAARHPDKVHGLALYSPTLWLSGRLVPWYVPMFRLIFAKWFANLFHFAVPSHVGIKDKRIRDFILNSLAATGGKGSPARTPGGAAYERGKLVTAAVKEIGRITQPVLILHSREDDYAGLDNATFLERKLAGSVDLVILDDCYHMVTIDRQRQTVLDRTTDFLARVALAPVRAVRGARPAARYAAGAQLMPAAA